MSLLIRGLVSSAVNHNCANDEGNNNSIDFDCLNNNDFELLVTTMMLMRVVLAVFSVSVVTSTTVTVQFGLNRCCIIWQC